MTDVNSIKALKAGMPSGKMSARRCTMAKSGKSSVALPPESIPGIESVMVSAIRSLHSM